MRRRGDFQIDLPLSIEPSRARDSGADRAACSQSTPVRVAQVLASVQGAAATVLPFKGMESFINIGEKGSPFLFCEQASQVDAARTSHQEVVQSSLVGTRKDEYQRDMFEMSQGGA